MHPPLIGMYTCGPTVYGDATIGNFRTYTLSDLIVRALQNNGYEVNHVMNLTDVGHLTGDNLGDADTGEDRLAQSAAKEHRSMWDIAQFYIDAFIKDFDDLNLVRPAKFVRATDHISEQIELAKILDRKGYLYKTSDGIYFDTSKFTPRERLSTLDVKGIRPGARVKLSPEKKNPTDFAIWKFTASANQEMTWDSPWGRGFPGWHLECSAMSMKYLGETFDIHVGGEDLASTHHPNEIIQSEAATGRLFVKYWIHGAFMLVDGGRMGKSLGNAYSIADIKQKGFNPLALRYLYLTAHYRDQLNFTWQSLEAAQTALNKLYDFVVKFRHTPGPERLALSREKLEKVDQFRQQFYVAIQNDLHFPQGLAILWSVIKSNIPSVDKYDLLLDFDQILGLNLAEAKPIEMQEIPPEVKKMIAERDNLRKQERWLEADLLRKEINKAGFEVQDSAVGSDVQKIADQQTVGKGRYFKGKIH